MLTPRLFFAVNTIHTLTATVSNYRPLITTTGTHVLSVGLLALVVGCGGGDKKDTSDATRTEATSSTALTQTSTTPIMTTAGGTTSATPMQPFLGMNLEEAQPESDTVGAQSLPFADVFRVARPFKEYSCPHITYDTNGWPTSIPSTCSTQANTFLKSATTGMLRNAPVGSIPEGQYTVLYEGSGTLAYSGLARGANTKTGRDYITVSIADKSATDKAAGLRIQITSTVPTNPIRNIRVVMPGGVCQSNPSIRVANATACAQGDYQDFATTLANRNAIVFNPDFLRFLKNFKVLRTMNFMKASPARPPVATLYPLKTASGAYLYDALGNPTYDTARPLAGNACYYKSTKGTAGNPTGTNAAYERAQNQEYYDCLLQPFTWSMRSTLDNAMWGGSGVTPLMQRYGRGVPLEVIIELANQLNMEPWFNIPHSADDNYVREFATLVKTRLKPTLKTHIEYSNETWNGIFWGAMYAREQGTRLGLYANNEFWAAAYYTSKRSKEIFQIWSTVFGGNSRLVRVLGSYYNNIDLSRNMLNYDNTAAVVDALAIAPYFRGCWDRLPTGCTTANAPKLLSQVTSVDEVFEIINNPNDPYGMSAVLAMVKKQRDLAASKNVSLVAYEGGQHLTVTWPAQPVRNSYSTDAAYQTALAAYNAEMTRLQGVRALFEAANRDARMKTAYTQLLTGWKNAGGKLFVLYTMPQNYHQWGSWGLKESLNAARETSPKYDAVMSFQEFWKQAWY